MQKIIGLVYDSKESWPIQPGQTEDANAEFDPEATIQEVASALASGGYQVKKISGVQALIEHLPHLNVDFVFNMAEGLYGRNRESQVPILLELYAIPYMGSDALTLGLTLDKSIAKKIFLAERIPTPQFFVATSSDCLKQAAEMDFPFFVKPCFEGTSKGISEASRVENETQLKNQIAMIFERYQQPALVEQFVRGREFTVLVFGNETPEAMPVIQYAINDNLVGGDDFYTFRHVAEESVRYVCPAAMAPELSFSLQDLAIRAYRSVGCRDFGRVDFRVNEQGEPFVLEVNPLPCLAQKDTFGHIAKAVGKTYEELILRMVHEGLKRLKMNLHQTGTRL